MLVLPWMVLVGLIVLLSAGLVMAAGWGYARWRHAPDPRALSALTVLAVAAPILLAVLVWGLFLKPQ